MVALSKLDFVDAMQANLRASAAVALLAADGAHARGNRDESRVFNLIAEALEAADELLLNQFPTPIKGGE